MTLEYIKNAVFERAKRINTGNSLLKKMAVPELVYFELMGEIYGIKGLLANDSLILSYRDSDTMELRFVKLYNENY